MTLEDVFVEIQRVCYPKNSPMVIYKIADLFAYEFELDDVQEVARKSLATKKKAFKLEIADKRRLKQIGIDHPGKIDRYIYLRVSPDSVWIAASHACYMYSFFLMLLDDDYDKEFSPLNRWTMTEPSFHWNRSTYDYFLTQEGREGIFLNPFNYISELARVGFTHVEINGLAYPMSLETGPKGETYPMFYTYCPALDQFVSSKLNKGLYPEYYLKANFDNMKMFAFKSIEHGMIPGLLCFEPRSVPEEFFQRYPMLRGGRVDHPFRSFKPRYTMTLSHPKVHEHYAEMLQKIMSEIPELGFISIWTNDSGAGFEHTKSLYVGRNGGAYMIREWKDDAEIAKVAGENALRFFQTLLDAGREINPEFRVMTRLESFYGEHDTVWKGLKKGIDAECNSLIGRGWEMPYAHPMYFDHYEINGGTIYQMGFDDEENKKMKELEKRSSLAHFYFTAGPHAMFEPLLGVPYPKLTYNRLKMLYDKGVKHLAQNGGGLPEFHVRYNINQEIIKRFQYNPNLDVDREIEDFAKTWAGERYYQKLVEAWKLTEEAIMDFPNITPLYSTHGFTWYRLWVRPFAPNFEAIPPEDRAYYEDFMCTTPHNPNNVDLSRDVLFRLTTPEKCRLHIARMDKSIWKNLKSAIELVSDFSIEDLPNDNHLIILFDQNIRLRALRCWLWTQRSVAAWISGVYGYMNAEAKADKQQYREQIRKMMLSEIENTEELLKICASPIQFMSMIDKGETPLMHGTNFRRLLAKRIELMKKHADDEPFIDHDYMMRMAGKRI